MISVSVACGSRILVWVDRSVAVVNFVFSLAGLLHVISQSYDALKIFVCFWFQSHDKFCWYSLMTNFSFLQIAFFRAIPGEIMDRAGNLNLQSWAIWDLLVLLQQIIQELQSRYTAETVHHHPPPPQARQSRPRVPRGSCGEDCRWCGAPCTRGSANHSGHSCFACKHLR